MAGNNGMVDEVIGQQAKKQVDELTESVKKLTESMTDAFKIANELNSATGLKAVSAGVAAVNNSTKAAKEYTLTIAAQATEQSRVRNEMKLTAKEISDTAGAYTNLDAAQQKAAKAARDAGIQFGIQSEQFKKLSATSNEYLGRLKSVDEALGNSRRNVGNYQGAVFSLSQVIRELPAFTYSAQMGFMAIGNNMPILIDQFKLLREQVGSTGKAISIFVRSIFSFVNVFTILSGLFTIFYKDIMEFVRGTEKASAVAGRWADSVTQARKEMYHLSNSLDLVKQGLKDKNEFLKEYNETLGKVLGNTKEVNVAEKNTLDKAHLYIQYIELRNKAEELLNDTLAKRKLIENLDATSWATMAKAQFGYAQSQYAKAAKAGGGGKAGGYSGIGAFFSGLFNTEDSFEWYKQQAMKEGEEATKAWVEMEKKLADFKKANGFTDDPTNPKAKKDKDDAIKLIEERYKDEVAIAKRMYNEKEISEVEYYARLYKLAEKYTADRAGLSAKEKSDEIRFNAELAEEKTKNFDHIAELLVEEYEFRQENYKKNLLNHKKYIDQKKKYDDEYTAYVKGQLDAQDRMEAQDNADREKELAEYNKWLDYYSGISEDAMSIVGSVADAMFAKKMQQFDYEDKRLKEYYDNELRFIEQSGFSAEKKEKMRQKLDAETEAKKKQIDRERVDALRKQARIQRALDINTIIGNTAIAITSHLKLPYPKNIVAIASDILIGGSQLARVLATPLPQYAKGRKGGKREWAVVGEAGQEAIVHNGRMELTPNAPTVTLLPEGASVIPNHELIKNAAYVQLSKSGSVDSDKYGAALLAAFEENTKETRELKNIMASKEYSMKVNSLENYKEYVKSILR